MSNVHLHSAHLQLPVYLRGATLRVSLFSGEGPLAVAVSGAPVFKVDDDYQVKIWSSEKAQHFYGSLFLCTL